MSREQRAGAVAKETGRLEGFSDGVFAVAMTLLVVTLQVPHLPGAISVPALGSALLAHWPSYLTFMTSFVTIFIMWASHHGIFKLVYKADTPFLFANGLLLLLVTVVPFPTALVAQYLVTPAATLACAIIVSTPGRLYPLVRGLVPQRHSLPAALGPPTRRVHVYGQPGERPPAAQARRDTLPPCAAPPACPAPRAVQPGADLRAAGATVPESPAAPP
jgi:hypothetical protein